MFALGVESPGQKYYLVKGEIMKIELIPINEIIPYENNIKEHPQEQVDKLKESIKEFDFNDPISIDENNVILEGHGRFIALKQLGEKEAKVIKIKHLNELQKKAYRIYHNQSTMSTGFDVEKLKIEIENIKLLSEKDINLVGIDIDKLIDIEIEIDSLLLSDKYELKDESKGELFNKFIIPPFSIIDSGKKEWLDIKNKWKEKFDSKRGRANNLIGEQYGTSEFDGAICEVFYKWFTPKKQKEVQIIDCFSGGVVRGAVASSLGFKYVGFDIREEQIKENIDISKKLSSYAEYICDDSKNVLKHIKEKSKDLLFSCPPYFDLEVYSNLNNDISNMDYIDFKKTYKKIINENCKTLKNNRFAIFVVGDVRSKDGTYLGLIRDTINYFEDAGLRLYNEIIYKEQVGTAPIRCVRPFNKNRKITKTHQNILVFYKGDTKLINKIYGDFF